MTSDKHDASTAAGSSGGSERQGRKTGTLILMGVLLFIGLFGGTALGIWQVQRRAWKLDLIQRVEARVHQPAAEAPDAADWPKITRDGDEYRHVFITGTFQNDKETYVQAVTDLGGGFWVMTPLVDDKGDTVFINRGFVPPEKKDPATRPEGQVAGPTRVEGLLRLDEPGGAFLRDNDPQDDRWYSRDLSAIGQARGLGTVAPYFIDADATRNPGGYPVGGLTQIKFHNSHLIYAVTWFSLALLSLAGVIMVLRSELKRRR